MLTEVQKNERYREIKRWLWAVCLGVGLGAISGCLSFINWLGGLGIGLITFSVLMLSTSPNPPDIEK